MISVDAKKLFLKGLTDTLPLIAAAIPFAVLFGALAVEAGVSVAAIMGVSIFVFAGASQFVAVTLIAASTPLVVIVATVFIVNLRHMLYTLSVMSRVKTVNRWLRIPMAFWMTDESYAVLTHYLQKNPSDKELHIYYWGSAVGMYTNWILFTAVGVFLAQAMPDMTHWGLDIAMILAFIAIVVPSLKNYSHMACALTACIAAIVTYDWPYKTGLLFSSLLAIAVGVLMEIYFTTKDEQ